MATDIIAFPVNLRKNNNRFNKGYGKYYPEADSKEPLNLKGFAKHISEHGKLVDYPMAVLVLQNIVSCLKEMVTTGQPVKLDGFGTFTPTIESDGTKAVNSVEESLNVGIDNLIAGVHLRFIPENAKGEAITSRKFADQCVFNVVGVTKITKVTQNGKTKRYSELQSMEKWRKDHTPTPSTGD